MKVINLKISFFLSALLFPVQLHRGRKELSPEALPLHFTAEIVRLSLWLPQIDYSDHDSLAMNVQT